MGLTNHIKSVKKTKELPALRKRRKAKIEPLEPRLLLSADLSLVDDGLRGEGFFPKVQESLNSSVFDEAVPLLGDQLSREAPGQIADSIYDALDGFELADNTPVDIETVKAELVKELGEMIQGEITVLGKDGDSEIRFQMTLAGTVSDKLDLDLGLPAESDILLEPKLGNEDVVDLDLNWRYEIVFGVNEISGFFIDTSAENEWVVNIEATLDDNFLGYGRLGLFTASIAEDPSQVETYDRRDMHGSWFVGSYLMDLKVQDGDGDDLLENDESPVIDAWLTGEGAANLDVDAAFVPDWLLNEDEQGDVMNLRITTDASISYTFDHADTQAAEFGDPIKMSFDNIELDTTEFMGGTFKPVIEFLQPIFKRAQPVFDFMNEEVPVLSDLNKWITDEPLTVLDLARTVLAGLAAGNEHDKLALGIEWVTQAINVVNAIVTGEETPQQSSPESLGAYKVEVSKDAPSRPHWIIIPNGKGDVLGHIKRTTGSNTFKELSGDLSFPILEDTNNLFSLMRGETDVSLWNFDLSGTLGFGYEVKFIIPPIPILSLKGELSFQFDVKFGAGGDTLGVKLFDEALDWTSMDTLKASASDNKDLIKKGFYFDDHNPDKVQDNLTDPVKLGGKRPDDPEFWLGLSLSGGPAVGGDFKVGKLEAGVKAKLDAGIFLDLNDLPNPLPVPHDLLDDPREAYPENPDDFTYDGRVRWDELEAVWDSHPLAIFNSGGKVSASLEAYAKATIGKGWFKVTLFNKTWSLGSREVLKFDFGGPTDDQILSGLVFAKASLGVVDDSGELSPYMGPTAYRRVAEGAGGVNLDTDVGEELTIKSLGWTDPDDPSLGETVEVEFEGWQQEFQYVKSITLDGGMGDDKIVVLPGVEADVALHGGEGNDTLDYRGNGRASLFGGAGDDHLLGGKGDDVLDGGDGDDEIEGREGDDDLLGGSGNDILRGGSGKDELWGELGDDFLDGGSGDDILTGAAGDDQYAWEVGSGADTFVENIDGGDDGITIGGGTEIVGSGSDGRSYVTEETGDLVTLSKNNDMVMIESSNGTVYLNHFEGLSVSAGGGPDTVIVNDLTGTDIKRLAIDLSQAGGEAADATGDTVIFNGSPAEDLIMVVGALEELPLTDLETGEIEVAERAVIKINDTTGGGDRTAYILNSDPETDRLEILGFAGDDHLSVGAGSDNVDVHTLINVTLEGGEGDDVLSTIYANTEVRGGVGSNRLVVSDGNFSETPLEVLLDDGSVEVRANGETESLLLYQDVEELQINLGSAEFGTDLFVRGDIAIPVEINGGSKSDTLIGPDGENSWEILGPDTGRLNGTHVSFNEIGNLSGGSGDDTFYFRGQGSVDGIVDGGDGFDLLDFLQSDFIQEAAASFLVTDLPIGDEVVPFAATEGITRIEDILVILLAEVQEDGTLVLNMGPRAAERLAINTEDGNEVFILTHVEGDPAAAEGEAIGVEAFGIYLEYEGVRAILGSGGLGDDMIFLNSDVMVPAELDGGPGNDLLVGGAGADVLRGGMGNDTLEGRAGNDVMDGGWGDDQYLIVPGSLDKVIDVQGVDTLDFSGALLGVRVDLNKGWGQTQKIDLAGKRLCLYGMIENAVGSEFNDVIYGNRLNNRLEGCGGDDWLFGSFGNDTLEGGDGRDRLYGEWGDDRLAGGAGNDSIEGGDGEDLLFFPGALTGVTVNLTCGGNSWSTDGLGGVDTLRWSIEGAIGTEHDDSLLGDDNHNVFYGMGGDDFIDGRGTDDVLYGGEGGDRILAGWGNDLVVWAEGEGNDTIDMGEGWDRVRMTIGDADDWVYLSSAARNNVRIDGVGSTVWSLSVTKGDIFEIYTGGGHDIVAVGNLSCTDVDEVVLYLGSGDDRVDGSLTNVPIRAYGQAGNDLFIGGRGNDTFDGGEGSDWVDYEYAPRRVHVDLAWGASQDGMGSKDYLKSIENVIGTQFDDMIWGTDGPNIIIALGGDDQVWARGGDDIVYAGSGDDKVWGDGGWGNDRLYGGWGDELFGEDGNDLLVGGSGKDVLDGGAGVNKLVDWPDKHKDSGDHGHGPFDKTTVSPCASWVKGFVTALGGDFGKNDPNDKIKITLPAEEKEKPGAECKGGKR